jgi:hypothetical protein
MRRPRTWEVRHVRVPRHDVVPAHEPADVVEEGVDWQRLRLTRRQAAFGDVGFECRYFAAVEVPIGAGAQEHAARHAGLPQLERLADDDGLEPGRLGVRCRREPIRSRTHNQEFGLLHTCRPLNKAVRRHAEDTNSDRSNHRVRKQVLRVGGGSRRRHFRESPT